MIKKKILNVSNIAKFDDQPIEIIKQNKDRFPAIWLEKPEHGINDASEIDLSFWYGICLEREDVDSPFESSEDVWNHIIQIHLEEIMSE